VPALSAGHHGPKQALALGAAHVLSCSAQLDAAADEQLLTLFGADSQSPDFAFAAAHLRWGGLAHEGHLKHDRGTGKGELADVVAAVGCSRQLGQAVGINTSHVPVVLITDNHMLRSFIMTGGLVSAGHYMNHSVSIMPPAQWGQAQPLLIWTVRPEALP